MHAHSKLNQHNVPIQTRAQEEDKRDSKAKYFAIGMSTLGQKQTCAAHKPMSAKCQ
jgi:hypothetical protein